jgi:hypothetical protein
MSMESGAFFDLPVIAAGEARLWRMSRVSKPDSLLFRDLPARVELNG